MIKKILKAYRRRKILQAIHHRRAHIRSYNADTNSFIVLDVIGHKEPVYQVYYWPADHCVVWDHLYDEYPAG